MRLPQVVQKLNPKVAPVKANNNNNNNQSFVISKSSLSTVSLSLRPTVTKIGSNGSNPSVCSSPSLRKTNQRHTHFWDQADESAVENSNLHYSGWIEKKTQEIKTIQGAFQQLRSQLGSMDAAAQVSRENLAKWLGVASREFSWEPYIDRLIPDGTSQKVETVRSSIEAVTQQCQKSLTYLESKKKIVAKASGGSLVAASMLQGLSINVLRRRSAIQDEEEENDGSFE